MATLFKKKQNLNLEKYEMEFSLQADKFISKIDKSLRKKIIRKFEWLAKNCEIINH
jgi:hypothetical protein